MWLCLKRLKASLPADTDMQPVFDPEEEYALYLKAVADSHIFLINRDVAATRA